MYKIIAIFLKKRIENVIYVTSLWRIAALVAAACFLTGCNGRRERTFAAYSTVNVQEEEEESSSEGAESLDSKETVESDLEEDAQVYVFVCGAVRQEGVYVFRSGARVFDAVEAAGGYAEDADTSYINQAALIEDEQQLWIPTREEARLLREELAAGTGTEIVDENRVGGTESTDRGENGSVSGSGDGSEAEDRININTADLEELQKIPGVGEVKAKRIIEYREEHGPFGAAEEITNVTGIGDVSYEKMKEYITI